jgi:hypothetical protein
MIADPYNVIDGMVEVLRDKCGDLGDEREVIRTLRDAEYSYGDIVALIDYATEKAVQLQTA